MGKGQQSGEVTQAPAHEIWGFHLKALKQQIISSTGNYMTVQFKTDDRNTHNGFRVVINYMPIEPYCLNWLNMTAKLLESPKYPTNNCSWVIIAPFVDSKIIINFEMFEVILCPKFL